MKNTSAGLYTYALHRAEILPAFRFRSTICLPLIRKVSPLEKNLPIPGKNTAKLAMELINFGFEIPEKAGNKGLLPPLISSFMKKTEKHIWI